MKILKTLIASLLLAAPASATWADDEPTHFVLCLNNGEEVSFVLEHNPRVVHGDGAITVVDEDMTIEYPLDDIHKYMLKTPTATDIDGAAGEGGTINAVAGDVLLNGFKPGMTVTVCGVDGAVVMSGTTDDRGNLTLRMSQYGEGVYVINAGDKGFKFIKR